MKEEEENRKTVEWDRVLGNIGCGWKVGLKDIF